MNKLYSYRLFSFFLVVFFTLHLGAQSFNFSGLVDADVTNPTSLQFGPNGKLYVSQQNGFITEFTVTRDGAAPGNGTYTATNAVKINAIKNGVPNHNDDGSISTIKKRLITGLYVAGTAANPILYVSSSDSRIGGTNSGEDTNLDTNSGVLSRLTWNGSGWDRVDLVRGLPRCEENHATNGMDMFTNGGSTYLMLQQGGNANEGAPSNNFAGTPETYLAGAMLIVNLTQLEGMAIYTDPRNGASYVYDLPTLNDPTRADITNTDPNFPYPSGHPMFNATIDEGDPFGGNDSRNQAFTEAGGPVQIFAPGFRNAYDVVVTDDGRIFSGDNGSNKDWGGPPVIRTAAGALKGDQSTTNYNPGAGDYVTNEFNLSNGTIDVDDGLHYVGNITDPNNTYYAGHPVPIRAFPSRAEVRVHVFDPSLMVPAWVVEDTYNWADLIIGVSGYFKTSFSIADFPDDTRQGEFLSGDVGNSKVNILDVVNFSTNGMCEYTATNFGGAMVGDLLTASYTPGGNINRYQLDASGTGLLAKDNSFLSGFASQPLDVIAQSDTDPFPGTIWAATYGADNITVFEPVDFGPCLQPGEAGYDPNEDSDSDGYTNGDEIDNGTDHCNGGSKPEDNDNDLVSDLNDPDDDNDGIPDVNDVFALDADNGTTTDLPINYPFLNNDPGTGFAGLGFTGWMSNGSSDYIDQYDLSNLSFGGAGGKATIDLVPEGDALGATNTQENGFQFGINVDTGSPAFTIHSEIEIPFSGVPPVDSQSYGIFIGNGDQDNYLKVVIMDGITNGDGIDGFEVVLENGGVPVSSTYDAPNLLAATAVDIYISVDPAANTAQPFYSLNGGNTIVQLGAPITLPTSFLSAADNTGMAVGMISTSAGAGPEFVATWDFIRVTEDGPANIVVDPDPIDFGALAVNSGEAQISSSALNTGGPATGPVQITGLTITGTDAALFQTFATTPATVGPGSSISIPVSFTPNSTEGQKNANLIITHSGANSPLTIPLSATLASTTVVSRINAGGEAVTATDGNMNWEFNADTGSYAGTTYSVNVGAIFDSDLTFANRHSSIPASMDEATFNALFAQERFDQSGGADMNFSIPVPNGTYTINLFMGNSFLDTSQVGERVFDIALEGTILKNDLDLITEFGHQSGGMLSLQTEVTDGVLNIVFLEEIESPLVNAIEVLAGGSAFSPIVIQPLADVNSEEGDSGTFFSVGSTGGDPAENFTYSISGNPNGTSIEPTNGQVSGVIAAGASMGSPDGNGIYTVTITVTKPGSLPVTQSLQWNILSEVWVDKDENENYTARHECSFVQAGDKFYLMGGRENALGVDVYDYENDSWINLANSAPQEFNHFQATEYQGLIWIIGAFKDNNFPIEEPADFIWIFDPATNDWIQGPPIPNARKRGSTGLVVYNDKFYIVGGNTIGHNGGYVPWFDEYDPATGIWTPLVDAPRARDHFSAVVIDDKLYLAGGRLSGGIGNVFTPTIAEVDVYDFTNETWSSLPSAQNIPTPRGGAAAVNFNDKLVVIGGEVENEVVYGVNRNDALEITEEYDPVAQSWSRIEDLNHKRHGTQAITSGGGIFILGGSPVKASGNQKNMEFFGFDTPVGTPSLASSLAAATNVIIADDTTEDILLNVTNGNEAIFVKSMQLSGPNAADFSIDSGELTNQLLNANSSHTLQVSLSGTGANRSAVLTITYGDDSIITINLANFDNSLNLEAIADQNNNEGDVVSLQVMANAASNYSASNLPPTLTINPTTGLISGTISNGGANVGPFEEENGLVIIEAESGTLETSWTTTTTGGATGIIAGSNHFNNQNGGTIPYEITITTPGVYRFNWRNFYSGSAATDENDSWLKFPNTNDVWFFGHLGDPGDEATLISNLQASTFTNIVFPIGSSRVTPDTTPKGNGSNGFFKAYRTGGNSEVYDWEAFTSDFEDYDIYVWFVNAGTYTMEVSERSAGHAIDKMALYKLDGPNYTDGQLTAAPESQRTAGDGASINSPYNVSISVTDNSTPPTTATTDFIWYIGATGDPIPVITATPDNGFAPLEVTFTGSSSTDDVGISSYTWDFMDGSPPVTTADPVHTFTTPGIYNVQLTVEDTDNNTAIATKEIIVRDSATDGDFRINTGGPSLSYNGQTWLADDYFAGGSVFSNNIPISNTGNDELYQSERFAGSGNITYQIPVASGDYTVNLHFAETFFGVSGSGSTGGVGSRIFNINIEGNQGVINNYDIVTAAGGSGKAVVENFQNVTVSDGNLTIVLTGIIQNPKINGIEVLLPANLTAPTVYAGDDVALSIDNTPLTLDGSAYDPDGGAIATYQWTQISGPNTATFNNATIEDPEIGGLVEGDYVFQLSATDDEAATATDEVTISVVGEPTTLFINSGGPAFTFDGTDWIADDYFNSGSTFPNPIPIANTENDQLYQTERFKIGNNSLIYEIPVQFAGEYNVDLHFAELFYGVAGGAPGGVGSRIFNVDVENGQGQLTNYDIVAAAGGSATAIIEDFKSINVTDGSLTITLTSVVENPKISGIGVFETRVPVVDAGTDQTIALPTNSVTINGTATDPDGGAIMSYQWTQVSGPSVATLTGDMSADLVASNLVEGAYIFRLTATDDENATGFDEIMITVLPDNGNVAPTAVATATPLSGDAPLEVTFTGSDSTDDVGVTGYSWDFKDGNTSTDADPTHTFTAEGTYEVELTVTDVDGLTDMATVTITVGQMGNQAPTALAEATPTAGEAPLTVSFTGSNSSDDEAIVGYAWDFMDGSTSTEADPSHIFTTEGIYDVELTVTDGEGLTGTATVQILVGTGPFAVVEADPLTGGAPLLVNFTGSGSTGSVAITGYSWDFGDGNSSTEADPQHIYTLPGTYSASLTVTDADGTTNTASIDIVVTAGSTMDIILETNPANPDDGGVVRIVVVNLPENVDVMNITVHDIGGRYVAGHVAESIEVGGMYEVPIAAFRNGVYLIRVVMSDGESTLLKLLVAN
ncbi:MAG: hypothetical protein Mars2KO_09860 [Maribacter sp.]